MAEFVVARIGKPHGIKGEVTVQVRTDDPDLRLAVGCELPTTPPDVGPLTITSRRLHNGILLLGFAEIPDRTAAEAVRNTLLLAAETADDDLDDEEAWRVEDLVGLPVFDADGQSLGEVSDLQLGAAQDRLVVITAAGDEVLVPFVHELVPVVDIAERRVEVHPPAGLFELYQEPQR